MVAFFWRDDRGESRLSSFLFESESDVDMCRVSFFRYFRCLIFYL